MLTDTHCHVQVQDFQADRPAVLQRARDAGVATLICVGYDLPTSTAAARLAQRPANEVGSPRLYASVGLHPHDAHDLTPALLDELRALSQTEGMVAVGECGLDYYRNLSTPEEQRRAFVAQIELATELRLPLIVHDREAHQEVYQLLREHGAKRGVMHCFSGDWDFARRCLDLGFFISLAGPVTFKNPRDLPDVARRVPTDALVLETDSPYLAPVPRRGTRNEPANVRYTAECVAALRGVELDQLAEQTSANATRLFNLS
ncbi:MAG TPA: TatD family hydrolase [Chloroflexota bacterium]|nr:TatD family hydrolase [Chloroflexota bacterium]